MPSVSILIPAFNEELLLGATLERVHASFAAIGHDAYEIVVCDNHSTDQTADAARARGARVVYEPHNQISRARNTAARAAQSPWLIFLDADTLLSAALLDATLRRLGSGQLCGGGSALRFDVARVGPFAGTMTFLWNRVSAWAGLAAGSYLFCLREAWEAVGGFDETVYAGEEIFFSRRIKRWGRARRLRFEVLQLAPVVTSARKVEWYGQWGLLWRCLLLIRPGAVKSREVCKLWYWRPPAKAAEQAAGK